MYLRVFGLGLPLTALVMSLSACNGTAVVTLTSTPSTDTFLTYRVGLVSVELQTSDGKSSIKVLPTSTTVDLAKLVNVSEVLGAPAVTKATYTAAVITVDYSSAEIVYDNGTVEGLALSPVNTSGAAMGKVSLTLTLDPSAQFSVTSGSTARLSLDFKLAASNLVNTTAKTATVVPLIVASASPLDGKQARVEGPLLTVDTADTRFLTGVSPFDFSIASAGELEITPTSATTYEINGTASTGATGMAQLGALSADSTTITYGTLTSSTTTTTTTTGGTSSTSTSTEVSFSASQVLAGTSAQSSSFDRVTGVVTARSGDTVTVDDGTLVSADGTNTFLTGTATIVVGSSTVVTLIGQGTSETNTIAQISVGSKIDAFGVAGTASSGNVELDASAGEVRLNTTTASGLVTAVGSGDLTVNLSYLGGRSIASFEFTDSGAAAASYAVSTGSLSLTYATVGEPVVLSGLTSSFGASTPNFTASALLDYTTIPAELVVDYGTGTAAPFVTYSSTEIDVNASNSAIGTRHVIQVGAESINIVGMASDPLIEPSSTSSYLLFAIAHTVTGTVENFNTYAAFITALQSELTGSVLVTRVSAVGEYTPSTYILAATSMTVTIDN
jgi:trimeric autotransporter adhesin